MMLRRVLNGAGAGTRTFADVSAEPFLTGTSGNYIEEMYNAWLKNRNSVHVSWDVYFSASHKGAPPGEAYKRPPNLAGRKTNELPLAEVSAGAAPSERSLRNHFKVQLVIDSYQNRGHLVAELDPLRMKFGNHNVFYDRKGKPDTKVVRNYLATVDNDKDMNALYHLPPTTYIGGNEKMLSLREIIRRLEGIYCNSIGAEFMFLESHEKVEWIKRKLETPNIMAVPNDKKKLILKRLIRASEFENFLAKKWSSEKRFGLEGCDVLIPSIKTIVDVSTELGIESIVMGMPHRGRLNVLANIFRKPLHLIFTQFASLPAEQQYSGDVKYHLGAHIQRVNRQTNKKVTLSLCANPSHLEAVNAIVLGKCRAEQFYGGDADGKKVMSMLIHGDAALAGQGIVYESLQLTNLPNYTTRGTIHLVVNNQIGFTTEPCHARSSSYCTDIAKIVDAPVFHVNSDEPEKVIYASIMAAEYRAKFNSDVVLDIVGYRRNGHNEVDEPMFTQPHMYKKIRQRKPIAEAYAEKLIKEGIVTEPEVNEIKKEYEKICEEAFQLSKKQSTIEFNQWIDSPWHGFFKPTNNRLKAPQTGVPEKTLRHIGNALSTQPPPQFNLSVHRSLDRIFKARMEMIESRQVDWALAEGMAFGSLLKEGVHVRLSGQDVERGTFSHRHHILHNQDAQQLTHTTLSHLYPDQANYTVCNSNLSEYGVLGFELGYSMTNPNALILWEAQFGDFNNTAQCIIDQFIASGETKWVRQSGLVLLLPHGMEGMGPEHSSARLERFLQMSDEDESTFPPEGDNFEIKQLHATNWTVVNPTTPANYFHILRRQIHLPFRKPLIVMSPKSLLRHPDAKSSFDEMTENTGFKRIIPDLGPASKNPKAKKLIFCSGKVYYELVKERSDQNMQDQVAISRLEQISPFPFDLIKSEAAKYPDAQLVWAQEEHKNYGAWSFVKPRILTAVNNKKSIKYAGRPCSASPATGSKHLHNKELAFLKEAIAL